MTTNTVDQLTELYSSFKEKFKLCLASADTTFDSLLDQELAARAQTPQSDPARLIYAPFANGFAGVSLGIDTVESLAEYCIALHRTPDGELGRRTHFWVDIWGRAEASRALQSELLTLWHEKPAADRVLVFQDGVKLLILECLGGMTSEQQLFADRLKFETICARLPTLVAGLS